MPTTPQPWRPVMIRRFIKGFATATSTVLVETDQGNGYLKVMGNRAGDHALACEWVGTNLARLLGLPTLDFAIIEVTEFDEIPLKPKGRALPGPAFITRAEKRVDWGGRERQLKSLINPEAIPRLVLLDTWTLNRDRYFHDGGTERVNRDNVFFSSEGAPPGRFVLKAMDHSHCFTAGQEITTRIGHIGCIKDERVYGLFPEFRRFMRRRRRRDEMQEYARRALRDLKAIPEGNVKAIVDGIPEQWGVGRAAREALTGFICQRAKFLAEREVSPMSSVWPQKEFPFMSEEEIQ